MPTNNMKQSSHFVSSPRAQLQKVPKKGSSETGATREVGRGVGE